MIRYKRLSLAYSQNTNAKPLATFYISYPPSRLSILCVSPLLSESFNINLHIQCDHQGFLIKAMLCISLQQLQASFLCYPQIQVMIHKDIRKRASFCSYCYPFPAIHLGSSHPITLASFCRNPPRKPNPGYCHRKGNIIRARSRPQEIQVETEDAMEIHMRYF